MFAQVRQADSQEVLLQTYSGQMLRPTESGQFSLATAENTLVLSDEQLGHIFTLITDPRNRAILALMGCAGLRMRELCALELHSLVKRGTGGLVLVSQRGRDTARLVPIGPWAFGIVMTYLDATSRELGGEGPLFLPREWTEGTTAGTHRMAVHQVALVVMRTLKIAGIEVRPMGEHSASDQQVAVVPEVMRHTFVARFLRAGGRVLTLQPLLGHRTVDQTRRYVHRLLGSGARWG